MNRYSNLSERPALLWGVSIAAAIAFGVLTSSVLGVGLFLVLPGAVQWMLRRR